MIKAWRNHCPAGLETGRPPGPGCLAIHTRRCLRTVVYSCASAFVIDALCDTRFASVLPRTKAKCPRRPDLARGSGAGAMRSELIVNHLSGHDRNSPGADLACMCLFLGLDFCFGLLMKRPVIRKTITMIAGPAMAVGHGRTRGVVLARLTVLKICIVNFESRRHIPRARGGEHRKKPASLKFTVHKVHPQAVFWAAYAPTVVCRAQRPPLFEDMVMPLSPVESVPLRTVQPNEVLEKGQPERYVPRAAL